MNIPIVPNPFESSFENLPTFWDAEFGFGPSDGHMPIEVRPTVRAFCFDQDGLISAVEGKHNPGNYYIPGGGVDAGETLLDATIREALEESGDAIANLKPLMRYLNRHIGTDRLYDIYIFTADIVTKGDPTTTQENEMNKEVKYLKPEEFIKLLGEQFEKDPRDTQSFVTKYALEKLIVR